MITLYIRGPLSTRLRLHMPCCADKVTTRKLEMLISKTHCSLNSRSHMHAISLKKVTQRTPGVFQDFCPQIARCERSLASAELADSTSAVSGNRRQSSVVCSAWRCGESTEAQCGLPPFSLCCGFLHQAMDKVSSRAFAPFFSSPVSFAHPRGPSLFRMIATTKGLAGSGGPVCVEV